jgi:hypothetical protein
MPKATKGKKALKGKAIAKKTLKLRLPARKSKPSQPIQPEEEEESSSSNSDSSEKITHIPEEDPFDGDKGQGEGGYEVEEDDKEPAPPMKRKHAPAINKSNKKSAILCPL